MGELERNLPHELTKDAVLCGDELVLPYIDASRAIAIATQHQIAVLGVESFEVRKDGFQIVDYTGYDRHISFAGDWKGYVAAMNGEAERWIKEHPLGENHGYILTSASKQEFDKLGSG